MYCILYYGDDKRIYARLKKNFPPNMNLVLANDWDHFQKTIRESTTHGVILAIRDPGPRDFRLIRRVINLPNAPGVIVAACRISAAQAVCCMRHGAFDCIAGPVNGSAIGASLNRMIGFNATESSKNRPLLTGSSHAVREIRARLKKFAKLPYPVLISGETGTGKELAAKTVHQHSDRSKGPLITVNCAAYADDLLGSEMFGTKKGAFTGAIDREGLIEHANGGTLFLDEIGEMSLRGQAFLLRVIDEGVLRRLGSNRPRPVDVRYITATNRKLSSAVEKGHFRADLYYRLNLLSVTMPPLRKRRQDIPELAHCYLQNLRPGVTWRLETETFASLARHNWPGNIRELQSVLLRATITAKKNLVLPKDIQLN